MNTSNSSSELKSTITNMDDMKSAGSIILRNNDMLVLKELKYKNEWIQPGGKRNANESLYKTAQRETLEETGIDINELENLGYVDDTKRAKFRTYFFRTNKNINVDISNDVNVLEYKWIGIDESKDLHFRLSYAKMKGSNRYMERQYMNLIKDDDIINDDIINDDIINDDIINDDIINDDYIHVNNNVDNVDNVVKKIFTEKINVKKAKYVYNLTMNEFKYIFWSKLEVDENGQGYELKTFYNEVRKFCGEVIRHKIKDEEFALIKRKYRYSNNKNGRIYSNGFGIQSLQGNIRKFLTGDYLLDIDIKNAHPNILYNLVLEYNNTHDEKLSMMYLENYCKNRSQILKDNKFDKTSLLICLNSDEIITNKKQKGFYTKNAFLIGFHKEKMDIFHKLINNTDYIKKYEISSINVDNPISSKVNKLFCIKENEIIQSVMNSEICVPMFDGFMFPKEEKEKYDYLLEEIGIIQWDYKPNLIDIDISDFDESKSKDYDSIKEEFEKDHCMIKSKPILFLERQINEDNKIEDVFYDEKGMNTILRCNKILDKEGKEKRFFDEWLDDKDKLVYDRFAFNPYVKQELDNTPNNIYNTFLPFQSEEIEDISNEQLTENVKWFTDFIYEIIADNEKESSEYILNYFAHLFQKPYENCQVSLVIRGSSGSGKDSLVDCIEKIQGEANSYTKRTTEIDKILPKGNGFNSELKNKLLVQFNETEGKDGIEAKERIKDHITRRVNIVHEKMINPYEQKNLTHFIFLSNQISPVVFMYNERRFALFKTGYKKSKQYYDNYHKNLEDRNKLNEVYTFLLRRDITEWNAQEDRPLNKAYKTAISNATPPHVKYLKEIFIDGNLTRFTVMKNKYFIKVKDLYSDYQRWLEDNHLLGDYSFKSMTFKKQLQDVNGITFDFKTNGSRYVMFKKSLIVNDLSKYTFTVQDDDEINLDDLSDDE